MTIAINSAKNEIPISFRLLSFFTQSKTKDSKVSCIAIYKALQNFWDQFTKSSKVALSLGNLVTTADFFRVSWAAAKFIIRVSLAAARREIGH